MSEDVIGKLTRFSPTSPGLDRDELLFRAGRASARSSWGWKVLAGVLAVTQVGTAVAWLLQPHPTPAVIAPPTVAPVAPEPEPEPSEPAPRNSYLILSRIDPDQPYRAAWIDSTTSPKPTRPLTAGWRGGPID